MDIVTLLYDEDVGVKGMEKTETRADHSESLDASWPFAAAIEATPAGMLLVDARGRIVLLNSQVERLFGFARSELIGESLGRLVPAQFRAEHFEQMVNYLRDPRTRAMGAGRDLYGLHRDGREVPIEIGLNPLHTPEGTFVLCSIIDNTERKAAESELRAHRERLEELVQERTQELRLAKAAAENANHAKSEFLANMSHELRTPMHAILAFAQLAIDRQPDEEVHEDLRCIMQSGTRLLGLLNGLLDLSKLETAKMTVDVARCELQQIVRDILDELKPLIESKRLRVELQSALGASSCEALVDRRLMRTAFLNVLANAVRFSREGQRIGVLFALVELSTSGAPTQHAVQIEFEDEGIGVPPDELDVIFEKFMQSSATRTAAGGTGLGLAICKQIIQLHSGTVYAKNNARGGATFVVILPVKSDVSDQPPHMRVSKPGERAAQ